VEVPGTKLLIDLQMKYWGRLDIQGDEVHGFRAAYVACEAIRRAVEAVGHENIDGAAINEALHSGKDFDSYGIGPIILHSLEDQRGSNLVRI
jgi:hypothetical protein